MSKYPEKLQEIVETISFFENQNDRINVLIDYAEKFVEVPDNVAAKPYPDENKVEYCESEAYVWTVKNPDNTFNLFFAVENPQGVSAKALCVILDEGLSGETAENILRVNTDLVLDVFGQSLSMGKNLGLTGIVHHVHNEVKKSM